MVRLNLKTQRTALVLYALLVVLPAAVFGTLMARQLTSDHERQLRDAPDAARDTATRLERTLGDALDTLLAREEERSVFDYRELRFRPGGPQVTYVPSDLVAAPRPEGVEAWFTFDNLMGLDGQPRLFTGSPVVDTVGAEQRERMLEAVREGVQRPFALQSPEMILKDKHLLVEEQHRRQAEASGLPLDTSSLRLHTRYHEFAEVAYNAHPEPERSGSGACARSDVSAAAHLLGLHELPLRLTPFEMHVQRHDGELYVLAYRRVMRDPLELGQGDVNAFPECLDDLLYTLDHVQGFLIDPVWLFERLPSSIAPRVLPGRYELLTPREAARVQGPDWVVAELDYLEGRGFEFDDPRDAHLGRLLLATDVAALGRTFQEQMLWFAALSLVMVVSLALGLNLLLGSLRASQEQARRTENFVAAVTHELRTPIASMRMYGEMLRDGWVQSEEKRAEYHARIVSEAQRLSGLVDRVLDKRRLEDGPPEPTPTDLAEEVRHVLADLGLAGSPDLTLDLPADLPPVLATRIGLHAVLSNLVENARKYAPVDLADPEAEPIRVQARVEGRRVLLEVLDRGPGIPDSERRRVFDPFYRVGDEATRRAPGTGLGLHLVDQYARAMRGRIELSPRLGGGTRFTLSLRIAKGARGAAGAPGEARPATGPPPDAGADPGTDPGAA